MVNDQLSLAKKFSYGVGHVLNVRVSRIVLMLFLFQMQFF